MLSHCVAERTSYQEVVDRLAGILGVSSVSLWLLSARRPMLGREVCRLPERGGAGADLRLLDEGLALWQKGRKSHKDQEEQVEPLVVRSESQLPAEVRHHWMPGSELISLPILYRETSLCGVLNLYGSADAPLPVVGDADDNALIELLRGVSGQLGIFVENRSLGSSSLLLQEIHHRVKNNLQIVASLLRMQIRRLDHVSAEQALQDSINRIHSIAVVHEQLSKTNIGQVDFSDLVRRLADSLGESLSADGRLKISAHGDPIMLESGDATSAALVANELMQNAIQHGGGGGGGGDVEVRVWSTGNQVRLEVQDHGKGLAPGFSLERDRHLGLTIVSTLVSSELHGEFGISSDSGTVAWVSFPVESPVLADGGGLQ